MLNKKLLAAISIAAVFSTSSAFAKTQGSYAGVDILATKVKAFGSNNSREDSIDPGIGFNYKYAINHNNIFVAPGVFYNFNNAEVNDSDGVKNKLKYSYGVKADFGYDVTDKFAPFVTFGYQENRNEISGITSSTDEALIYGIGAKYSVADNIDVSLAYEYVDYNKSGSANSINPDVIRFGAAYKF